MTYNEIRIEAMKPDSEISSGRYAFLAQIRLVTIIVIWALVAVTAVIIYGVSKDTLSALGSVITSISIAAATIAGVLSLMAFGGKVGQTVAENKYTPPPPGGTGVVK